LSSGSSATGTKTTALSSGSSATGTGTVSHISYDLCVANPWV
jgi:hypothetical protein